MKFSPLDAKEIKQVVVALNRQTTSTIGFNESEVKGVYLLKLPLSTYFVVVGGNGSGDYSACFPLDVTTNTALGAKQESQSVGLMVSNLDLDLIATSLLYATLGFL